MAGKENHMEELWKDVVGFPNYEVSNQGRVKNKETGLILTPHLRSGYWGISLPIGNNKKCTKTIHRLVAEAFLGVNPGLATNHIDGNKLNNHVNNLEWVTHKENSRLAAELGLYKTRPVKIIETNEVFRSVADCAKAIKMDPSDINHVIAGVRPSAIGLHFEYVSKERIDDLNDISFPEHFLYDYQFDAVEKMKTGCILNGGVGSGKSRTGLYYYFKEYGGSFNPEYVPMTDPPDLYVITTAHKRDLKEFNGELIPFLLSPNPDLNGYANKIVIDSWNNIKKYSNVTGAFFLFDEDRVTGSGSWVKAFLKIAKRNKWIILSASPGDTWSDYIPVFVANGFYKNKTEFLSEHVLFNPRTPYPKIDGYINTGRLIKYRDSILIPMDFRRNTIPHHEDVYVSYDITKYKTAVRTRWNPFKNEPVENAGALCYLLRKIVNSDESRQLALLKIFEEHPKIIVFYNFDYELEILRNLVYGDKVSVAEWNGHFHQDLPKSDSWVYLVQYTSGNEGWNCITTDTIVFYSQNYSYKVMFQAAGRIDRLNTLFTDLYYFHLKSRSGIDLAISITLKSKKTFNEEKYVKWDSKPRGNSNLQKTLLYDAENIPKNLFPADNITFQGFDKKYSNFI